MITRNLSHGDMVALLERTGIAERRPDLGLLLLSGHSRYREDGIEYMLAGSMAPAKDGEASIAVPAPAPAPVETRRAAHKPVDASQAIVDAATKAVADADAEGIRDEDASGDITRDALKRAGL